MIRKCLVLAMACLLAGCGGGGGGTAGTSNRAPTQQTRDNVQKTHNFAIRSIGQSGAPLGPRFAPMPGEQGGMAPHGLPMPGGFIRHNAPPTMGGPRAGRGDEGGGGSTDPDPGTGGGDPPPPPEFDDFYFDEWLGLWVQVSFADTQFRQDFYVDEAKAQTAGFMLSTWPSDWNSYPVAWRTEYQFSAGVLNGSRGVYESSMTSETTGSMNYDATWSGDHYRGRSSWNGGTMSWANRSDAADGSWSNDSGEYAADGTSTIQSENSLGYRTQYNWSADGSGNGRLEGPDAGLPATLRWDSEGNGVITYADGSTEEFHWWRTISSDDVPR